MYTPAFKDVTIYISTVIRIMSDSVLCREAGLRIIRILLGDHNKIVYRSLYTEQAAPVNDVLELLTQFAKFQHGQYADEVYAALDFSSLIYSKILSSLKIRSEEDEQRALSQHLTSNGTMRYHMIELLLVLLEFCSFTRKSDLLGHRSLILPWLSNATADSSEQLIRTVATFFKYGEDKSILRRQKTLFFTEWVLIRIVSIYRVLRTRNNRQWTKYELEFSLLVKICTYPEYGVIYPDNGWYPPGTLDATKSRRSFQFYNRVLVALTKHLDVADEDEFSLLNSIFKACPETVAAYTTSVLTKIDPTNDIDVLKKFPYFSSIISLPIPAVLEDWSLDIGESPPAAIIIENVLPSPLNRPLLDLALHKSAITQYFVLNLIAQTLQKLDRICAIMSSRGWESARSAVLVAVFHRLPELQSYASTVTKSISPNSGFVMSKLLKLYINLFPEVSAGAKVDLSQLLIRFIEGDSGDKSGTALKFGLVGWLELRNVLQVQSSLPTPQKFWNKAGTTAIYANYRKTLLIAKAMQTV